MLFPRIYYNFKIRVLKLKCNINGRVLHISDALRKKFEKN